MKTLPIFLLLFWAEICFGQNLSQESIHTIEQFIAKLSEGDKAAIAASTSYPLRRKHPIDPIDDGEEFIERFEEVFDAEFLQKIIDSNIEEDWFSGGWRGLAFSNGALWINEDGTLIAVNHQSNKEKQLWAKALKKDKASIHSSLKNYSKPILQWKTKDYLLRIDQLENGSYRYVSWKKGKNIKEKPDLVLKNGTISPHQASSGAHSYVFVNGDYTYQCFVGIITASHLTVKKEDKVILDQEVIEEFR